MELNKEMFAKPTAHYGFTQHLGDGDTPDVFMVYDLMGSPKTVREDFPAVYLDVTRKMGRGLWNDLFLYMNQHGVYLGIMMIGDKAVVYEPARDTELTDETEAVAAIRDVHRRCREQKSKEELRNG